MRRMKISVMDWRVLVVFFYVACLNRRLGIHAQELRKGFVASPKPSSSSFQKLLSDPSGSFWFGFSRVASEQVTVSIVHAQSGEKLWSPDLSLLPRWTESTQLIFNGSLVLSDREIGLCWSTKTVGDRVVLLNSSDLQIQMFQSSPTSVLWKSFDFPSDTLVTDQNFTSTMSLVSIDRRYSMRLGNNFMGLYASFGEGSHPQMYWKRTALQSRANINVEFGALYARLSSDGSFNLYQYQRTEALVDTLAFDTYNKLDDNLRTLKLEADGNLRGYFWNGTQWESDFKAITDFCELPSSCGAYGVCLPGEACQCLDTNYSPGFCNKRQYESSCDRWRKEGYEVMRRKGVDLAFKEWMKFVVTDSLDKCEGSCESNCSCRGAIYNNVTGYCYMVDYPIQTFVSVKDDKKIGYFKVAIMPKQKKRGFGVVVGIVVSIAACLAFVGCICLGVYKRKKRKTSLVEEELCPGPYKNLKAGSNSIELSKR